VAVVVDVPSRSPLAVVGMVGKAISPSLVYREQMTIYPPRQEPVKQAQQERQE